MSGWVSGQWTHVRRQQQDIVFVSAKDEWCESLDCHRPLVAGAVSIWRPTGDDGRFWGHPAVCSSRDSRTEVRHLPIMMGCWTVVLSCTADANACRRYTSLTELCLATLCYLWIGIRRLGSRCVREATAGESSSVLFDNSVQLFSLHCFAVQLFSFHCVTVQLFSVHCLTVPLFYCAIVVCALFRLSVSVTCNID